MFPKDLHILVVDDSNVVRSLLKQQLISLGLQHIYEAEEGKEAVTILEKHFAGDAPIDLLIVDWNMTGLSGIDFLGKVRKDERFKKIPFLMMSGESEVSSMIKAIVLGVTDYVVKPFTSQILRDKLDGIWSRMHLVK